MALPINNIKVIELYYSPNFYFNYYGVYYIIGAKNFRLFLIT